MATQNKRKFANVIGREVYGLSCKEAYTIVDYLFELMGEALLRGEELRIDGFGTFKLIDHNAYTTRHPKTGDEIHIAARQKVRFRLASALKRRLNLQKGANVSNES